MESPARWKWGSFVLLALLIASNVWWAYGAVDRRVTLTYTRQSLTEKREAVEQLERVCLRLEPGMSRAAVLPVMRDVAGRFDPFEKDGAIHAGRLAFRFDEAGGLDRVTAP